jgi:hypothetical protein
MANCRAGDLGDAATRQAYRFHHPVGARRSHARGDSFRRLQLLEMKGLGFFKKFDLALMV